MRVSLIMLLVALGGPGMARASEPEAYINRVVEAIYRAEGGKRAKVPYGVLSVKVKTKAEARQVCYNTVRNTYRRWVKAGRPEPFLLTLAKRYAPVGAENDPKNLNQNWYRNVKKVMYEK